jgi:hypothetical protein
LKFLLAGLFQRSESYVFFDKPASRYAVTRSIPLNPAKHWAVLR